MRKKVISIILAAIMVVGMMPFGALAAGNVAKIGTIEYETLQAAVDAVKDGETIVLTDDVTEPAIKRFGPKTSFTIDLNGKTWKSTNEVVFYCMNTDLTIVDSFGGGVITNEEGTGTPEDTTAVFDGTVNSQFHFNGGTIKNHSDLPLVSGFFDQKYDFKGSDVESYGEGPLIGASEFSPDMPETEITAGKFTGIEKEEIEQYLSEDAEVDENGEVTVKAVCEINGTQYPSLAAAVAAVPAGTETTITLIADVDLGDYGTCGIEIPAGKEIVLDLAGKKITGKTTSTESSALINNKGTLTITDSSSGKTGSITCDATDPWVYTEANPGGYASNLISNTGTVTVVAGNLKNNAAGSACYVIDNYNAGNANINGGNLETAKCTVVRGFNNTGAINVTGGTLTSPGSYPIQTRYGLAKINVSGGTLTSNCPDKYTICIFDENDAEIQITGGTFNGSLYTQDAKSVKISGDAYVDGVLEFKADEVAVEGGTFTQEVPEEYLANGFAPVKNEKGEYVVLEKEVCKINDKTYPSLEAAIEDVPAGAETTITLLEDITVDANIGVKVAKGQNIVLDLNGKTYTQNAPDKAAAYVIENNGQLTITDTSEDKDGVITLVPAQPDYAWSPAYASNVVTNRGSLTIEAGSLINDEEPRNASGMPASGCYAVDCYAGSSLTVNGGTLKSGYIAVRTFNTSGGNTISVDVNGGTLEGMYCFYLQQASGTNTSTKAEVNITDGTFKSTDRDIFYSDAEIEDIVEVNVEDGTFEYQDGRTCFNIDGKVVDVEVSGGTYSSEVPIEYCAKGFTPQKNKDGEYVVDEGTLTNYYIDAKKCQSLDGEGGLMGRQYNVNDNSIGRAIIGLTEDQLNALNGSDKLVLVGGDYDAETTVEVDCAYTYFYNGEEKVTAESMNVAAFVIIDADEFGGYISGYGYYRLYKDNAESEDNFLFDTLFVNPNY